MKWSGGGGGLCNTDNTQYLFWGWVGSKGSITWTHGKSQPTNPQGLRSPPPPHLFPAIQAPQPFPSHTSPNSCLEREERDYDMTNPPAGAHCTQSAHSTSLLSTVQNFHATSTSDEKQSAAHVLAAGLHIC